MFVGSVAWRASAYSRKRSRRIARAQITRATEPGTALVTQATSIGQAKIDYVTAIKLADETYAGKNQTETTEWVGESATVGTNLSSDLNSAATQQVTETEAGEATYRTAETSATVQRAEDRVQEETGFWSWIASGISTAWGQAVASADPNLPVNAELRAPKTAADQTYIDTQAPTLQQSASDLVGAEANMTSGLAATVSEKVANDLAAESGFIDGMGSVTATYSHSTTNERLGYVKGNITRLGGRAITFSGAGKTQLIAYAE